MLTNKKQMSNITTELTLLSHLCEPEFTEVSGATLV